MKKNGKFTKRGVATKVMVMILSLMLVVGLSVGGTIAWLTAESGTVENTFTVGDITIDLKEHTLDDKGALTETETTEWEYEHIIPGDELKKDPFVKVLANSEASIVFIKVIEKNNIDVKVSDTATEKALIYSVDQSWTALDGVKGVYYKNAAATGANASEPMYILTGNKVEVSDYVTKTDITTMKKSVPGLYFMAAAIQSENIDTTDMNAVYTQLPAAFVNYAGPTA